MDIPVIGVIYKLIIGAEYYIGSTVESLQGRMSSHYRQAIETPERKLYKAVLKNGGWETVKLEVIEMNIVKNAEELRNKEETYINKDDVLCLNIKRAVLTPEERVALKKEVSSRCKKAKYAIDSKVPEWREKERAKKKELYN